MTLLIHGATGINQRTAQTIEMDGFAEQKKRVGIHKYSRIE